MFYKHDLIMFASAAFPFAYSQQKMKNKNIKVKNVLKGKRMLETIQIYLCVYHFKHIYIYGLNTLTLLFCFIFFFNLFMYVAFTHMSHHKLYLYFI